jgi:hypothetical protein
MSRPKFEPTEEQRLMVKSLSAYGIKQEAIARRVGLRSTKSLRKHFRDELDLGAIEAVAQVSQVLYQMARSGKHPAATIHFLTTRTRLLDLGVRPVDDPPQKREVSRIVWRTDKQLKPTLPPRPAKLASRQPTEPVPVPPDFSASDEAEEQPPEADNPTFLTLQAENAKEPEEEQADDALD